MNKEPADDKRASALHFEQAVNKPTSSSLTPPAEGERRAVIGLFAQYRISASLILLSLRDQTLEWIRVADPKAGRVDDFN